MPNVKDDNGNHIVDDNGNKLEYTVTYENQDPNYKYKEPLHINDYGHIDSENRSFVIKDATEDEHAVSLVQVKQLLASQPSDDPTPIIMTQVDNKRLQMQTNIHTDIGEDITSLRTKLRSEIQTAMTTLRDEREPYAENEIHKGQLQIFETLKVVFDDLKLVNVVGGSKTGNIPRTTHTWHTLVEKSDIPNADNALRIMIMNTYIK